MFVLQIFVMRNGAFEGVEMACGERIVIGPPGADVPLAGAAGAGVALTLEGDRLIASPLAQAIRVDGELVNGPTPLSPASDVGIGELTLKLRRPSVTRDAPATVELGAIATQAVTLQETPLALLAVTEPDPQEPVTSPFAALAEHAEEEPEEEPDWSLVEALARPADSGTGALVEVIRTQGERVLDHLLLDGSDVFGLDGRTLVRRRAQGGCEIVLPPGAAARARRGGELTDVLAGPTPLPLVLASGDAATLRVGTSLLLVRFATRPRVAWSAAQRIARRAEQRAQAWCASAGLALSATCAGALWLLDYRAREIAIPLDDDITQWPDVEIALDPPPRREPEPEPEPQLELVQRTEPRADSPPPRLAKVTPEKGALTVDRARSALDVAAGLPMLKSNRAIDAAMSNMRAPLPARPGGLIVQPLIDRSGRVGGAWVGGSGLSTSEGAKGLRRGAGALVQGSGRAVGGTVARGQLRDLRVPPEQGLSREQILRVINEHVGQIQSCYERGLRDDGSLGGRVVAAWSIAPDGSVSVTRVQTSTLGAASVERCILDRIERWRFPASRARSEVIFPFSFSAL